jgi:hypothetical protein
VWLPRRPMTDGRLAEVVSEVAALGRRDGVPLAGSEHWERLGGHLRDLPTTPAAGAVHAAADRLGAVAGDLALSFGASHGDFTPWNLACLDDRVLVWDWERFRTGVPVGSDLLHHHLQSDLVARRVEPREAADRLVTRAPELLAPLGVSRDAARVTALVHGLDLATRYLADRQQEAGARLGDVGHWLLPAVLGGITALEEEK